MAGQQALLYVLRDSPCHVQHMRKKEWVRKQLELSTIPHHKPSSSSSSISRRQSCFSFARILQLFSFSSFTRSACRSVARSVGSLQICETLYERQLLFVLALNNTCGWSGAHICFFSFQFHFLLLLCMVRPSSTSRRNLILFFHFIAGHIRSISISHIFARTSERLNRYTHSRQTDRRGERATDRQTSCALSLVHIKLPTHWLTGSHLVGPFVHRQSG